MIPPEEFAKVVEKVDGCLVEAKATPSKIEKNRNYVIALEHSCNLLTKLLNDDDIFIRYDKVVEIGNREAFTFSKKSNAVKVVTVDRETFESFWQVEMKLLRAAGYDEKYIELLSRNIWERVQSMKNNPAIPAEVLRDEIKKLQIRICSKGDYFARTLESEHKKNALLFVFGGLGIISANLFTHLAAIDGGASCGIGGGLVGHSITELFPQISQNRKIS